MTNENNKSDYTKPFMDLSKLLPEPYQSDVNISLFNDLFNRYLTKQDIDKISGYIGPSNERAITSRQIKEIDVHRQAYQLQPILHNKIGSVEHMASWKDLQNELERLGVDVADFANWGATEKFNWVPPVDINKIINYKDYYWVDKTRSLPQYITIRSRCATATSRTTFWDNIISQYGSTFPIEEILEADNIDALQTYSIATIGTGTGIISITGDATEDFSTGHFFNVTNTSNNNGIYQITSAPIYEGTSNTTELVVSGLVSNETIGTVSLRRYNKIVLSANYVTSYEGSPQELVFTGKENGDYTGLFEKGFIVFLRNLSNDELNNTYAEVVSSEHDFDNATTTITISISVTDNTFAGGEASLEEQQSVYVAEKNCQCGILGGWDDGTLWDDNPSLPLWGDTEDAAGNPTPDGISDHQNLLDRINNPVPPSAPGTQNELWHDTTSNKLYQYDTTSDWNIVWNSFNLILDATTGFALWDQTPECDTRPRIAAAEQWVAQNKWQHKNDVANYASVRRATQPIIEYDWDLELNEWTYIDYRWSYRAEIDDTFVETDNTPPSIEITPITWWELENVGDINNKTVILDSRYGDLTDWFSPDKKLYISAGSTITVYEVEYSTYKTPPNTSDYPYRTYITFKVKPNSTGDLDNQRPNTYEIYPLDTVQGDLWQGYGTHWLFLGAKDAVPVSHRVDNPYIPIADGTSGIPLYTDGSPRESIYEYRSSLYSQSYLVTSTTGRSKFELLDELPLSTTSTPLDTRSLRRKALYGFDDIRVYTGDSAGDDIIRQFGNYDEIAEVVLNVIGIDYNTSEFLVDGDYSSYFPNGDTIRLRDNTGIGTMDFTVSNTPPTNANRIRVVAPGSPNKIPDNADANGEISNVTHPISSDGFTNSKNVSIYVMGVEFFSPIGAGDNVIIEVGSAAVGELSSSYNSVRMLENNEQYLITGDVPVSQIQYRKVEQVKTKANQYPLFDIFTVAGATAYKANPIFGYSTDSGYDVNSNTGLRIVYDSVNNIYEFDQFLLEKDDGELLAYRDYANKQEDYWYNPETSELKFWAGTEWADRTAMSNHYSKAVVSELEPSIRERLIDGLYWYNTTLNKLYKRFINPSTDVGIWNEISGVDILVTDANLQTIWKGGLNDELYVPDKVDWERRSEVEYNTEKQIYVDTKVLVLLIEDSSLSEADAIILATQEWHTKESNHLSSNGHWVGDWEIPDPLYFNHLHENRKYLNGRELLTHFSTIIENQPKIPGFVGAKDGMFNLIPTNSVNYGFGGTIKEFNNGFDTLLSSTFVNNVTPRTLIEYARDQYEGLLNSLKEIYREDATTLLTNLEIDNILDLSSYVSSNVIDAHELNDRASFVYGDSTTFTDVAGGTDLGVRNWIATLPYLNLVNHQTPERIIDDQLSINEVVHHDGHRKGYTLTTASADIISQLVVASPDPRTSSDTLGKSSSNLPPNTVADFESNFGGQISNREGVYWYHVPTTGSNTLYRYIVANSGTSTPSSSYPDGTLWMDLEPGQEVLRMKNTNFQGTVTWDIVTGLTTGDGRLHNGTDSADVTTATISAWKKIELNTLLNDTIFELESKLYNNVPTFAQPSLAYDFDLLKTQNPSKYQTYLEEAFLDYVSQAEITTPYKNSEYSSTDPFTWNYSRSANNGSISIIEADGLTNSFVVAGNRVAFFDPCTDSATASPNFGNCPSVVQFFIKNSNINDGTWLTLSSTSSEPTTYYDAGDDTTRIFVEGDVLDSIKGIIYSGTLPSLIAVPEKCNNLNDGSESGGHWRDLYTKIYGTPYPHAEPWILQGYNSKPDWWDVEYRNNDVEQWGERKWKYQHGFQIQKVDNNNTDSIDGTHGIFAIRGDFHTNFTTNETFTIDSSTGSPTHDGTYTVAAHDDIITVNTGAAGTASIVIADVPPDPAAAIYQPGMIFAVSEPVGGSPLTHIIIKSYTIKSVFHALNEFTILVDEAINSDDITPGTHFINGVIYNPITNLTEIKIPGLVVSDVPSGRINQAFGMWENIRVGRIPAGRTYPNGVVSITGRPIEDALTGLTTPNLPTFNYFSVNIDNVTVSADGGTTNYITDSTFPPYWDYVSAFSSIPLGLDATIRSLYYDFSTEIISPNANYTFGDSGTVEWIWRSSSQFLYDQLTVAFRIDPMKFMSSTFGFNITKIGNLQVDRDNKNTPSHNRISFHGEIVNNEQFKSYGLNQWYVNYNRYAGYDASFSDFRELWTGWKAPLTYQFASFVDTPSLSIGHRYVNVSNFDYNISAKRAPGVDDFWLDAFKIGIISIPYNIARYDNQLDWRFELKTNIPISRSIKYYDTHNYQFYVDSTTNVCSLYSWKIESIDTFDKTFTVVGDQTYVFTAGRQFEISGSTGNNRTYDVTNSLYDSITDTTIVSVNNTILSAVKDGIIKAAYRELPWSTGDGIYLSTVETLPIPLISDTVNGLTKYFIIVLSPTTFMLAETQIDAETNAAIDITSTGKRDHFVGEITSTFIANDGVRSTNNWRYYTLDKSNILEISTPHEVQGMQTLVNIIHGYGAYINDIGWKINEDKSLQDPDTGRIVDWQVEMERFITYAYSQRFVKEQINDRYPVTVNDSTNEWTFVSENKTFITGDVVTVISSNSIYPSPISRGVRYYIIRDDLSAFKLAASKQDAQDDIAIDILSTTNVGNLSVTVPKELGRTIQEFEINPFRNASWFNPPRGIVSNIITGPSEDIRTTQLVFDQNGNRINSDQLRVYRQDKQTKISVVNAAAGETLPLISAEYSLLHLGGLHLFIDAYEHVMTLNNYTSDGNLLYDPFIGLNVTKYEMSFNRQPEFTQRPNVGGYYLETFFNQGANIKENIEAGVENLRNAYDTFNTLETNLMTQYSRKALGYEGTEEYLTNLNLSQKSQFLFWRGQIQSKGSINAVKAFINSRRFIDAKIDDFWAIKLGSFGSMGEREFPEMYVTTVDARSNELRLEFIDNDTEVSTVEETFTAIKMSDTDRWYKQPDQTAVLRDNGKIMYFDMKTKNKYPGEGASVVTISNNSKTFIKHLLNSDTVEVTETGTNVPLVEGTHYNIVNSDIIEWLPSGSPTAVVADIIIWGKVYDNDAQNPARIVDRKSETQISPIQYWDPARGVHYSNAIHNVDLQNDLDPAQYSNTSQTVSYSGTWKENFVGTSWFNTENLDYVPYYSKEVFPDTTERFRNWGQLSDWSGIELYEWVESDVPPEEWDALAATEEGDRTIVEHLRKAGTARKVLFEKDGSDWIPTVNKYQEFYVATTPQAAGKYEFPTTSLTGEIVDIYINGKLYLAQETIGSQVKISITVLKETDIVRFVKPIPTEQVDIDILLAGSPETHRQEYEYTQVSSYDELGNISYKYYFWVGSKGTKPTGKNRTMSIAEAQIQLVSIPSAHIFFQEVKPSESVAVDDVAIIRIESTIATGFPPINTYQTDLPIAANTTVLVEVDGLDLLDSEIVYTTGTTSVVIIPTLSDGEVVKITYTGIDDSKLINLPYRFTQAIIRGLQGIVNADNRYTIRYTRNFTLRDKLDVENENVGSMDLKNLHEEWKIFRQEQQFNIDRWQWDKITEAIIGYKLNDAGTRVPSYERELYDEKYGTDTQYGLGDGQTFVNSTLALNTITTYLINPAFDFTPIDIDIFFAVNNFDTPGSIITAMDEIYNTFPYAHVNRMYFSVLKDAFTTKAKYPDIFKTSMVSLHGIRPFQSSGIFDD